MSHHSKTTYTYRANISAFIIDKFEVESENEYYVDYRYYYPKPRDGKDYAIVRCDRVTRHFRFFRTYKEAKNEILKYLNQKLEKANRDVQIITQKINQLKTKSKIE